MRKKIGYFVAMAALLLVACRLLGDDVKSFIQWYSVLLLVGLAFLPMTALLFKNFHDKGYMFAKPIGIALSGYLLWLLSSIKLVKFTSLNGTICLLVLLIPNIYLLLLAKKGKIKLDLHNEVIDVFCQEELFFLLIFLVWTYIRCFKPEAYGTEKFMDYGFMASMMRSDYMPPNDMWYAGGTINYYYFGQYLATFLTKISHVSVKVGYNLMLMMVAAFATMLPYSIVYNLTHRMLEKKKMVKKALPAISGIFAGLLIPCAANMHFPIFKWVVPALRDMLGIEGEYRAYWFADSTRYIGYQPDTTDKTIHEFPSYSILLGDLHAHYINIIFVLTVVALLLAWLIGQEKKRELDLYDVNNDKNALKEAFASQLLMITFFIGIFHMTNYWDFPIYYVVSGAVILCSNAINNQFSKKTVAITAIQGIVIMLGSMIVALPFTMTFDQISTEVALAVNHTPIYQLCILWGLPIITIFGFFCTTLKKTQGGEVVVPWVRFKNYLTNLSYTDLFVILLGFCAIGLVFMPEVIYVKDIYTGDYKRANTMFKLTYQAFIMFGMCSGYILVKLIAIGETLHQKRWAKVGIVLACLCIYYVVDATNLWIGNIFNRDNFDGLDATAFMTTDMTDDSLAVDWLNENVEGYAVVLEAPGDSYSDYERVSAMTGLSTVNGWYVHEWLWRNDTTDLNNRNADIEAIYTGTDQAYIMDLIEKYDIDYIYVGSLEYGKYPSINEDMIRSLGEVAFESPRSESKAFATYIVKVARN